MGFAFLAIVVIVIGFAIRSMPARSGKGSMKLLGYGVMGLGVVLAFMNAIQLIGVGEVGVKHFLGRIDPVPLELGGIAVTEEVEGADLADLDGDGDLDLVTANDETDNLAIFRHQGPADFDDAPRTIGEFETRVGFPAVAALAAADLDRTGEFCACPGEKLCPFVGIELLRREHGNEFLISEF